MKLLALLLLLPFTATAQTGSASLSWMPPTQNTDGTALTNLAAYKVYWGASQTTFPNSTTINNPGIAGYTVSPLSPGLWYFRVSALNAAGSESTPSNVASKLIAGAAPNPPSIPRPVTNAGPVCTLQVTDDALLCPQVGTVPSGVGCDPTQQIAFLGKTYMLVPKASVVPLAGMQVIAAWSDTCH